MKSDDVTGRVKTYEAIVKGHNIPKPGVPESFKVLVKELQSLCLDVRVLDKDGAEIELKDDEDDDTFQAVGEMRYSDDNEFTDSGYGFKDENGDDIELLADGDDDYEEEDEEVVLDDDFDDGDEM